MAHPHKERQALTAPDPLREDEVIEVANAIFQDCGGWFHERFDISVEDLEDTARAAILRLDQVREGRK